MYPWLISAIATGMPHFINGDLGYRDHETSYSHVTSGLASAEGSNYLYPGLVYIESGDQTGNHNTDSSRGQSTPDRENAQYMGWMEAEADPSVGRRCCALSA